MIRAALIAAALAGVAAAGAPADWIGTWKGQCKLTPAYNGVEAFAASLTISAGSADGSLRWKLIYETPSREVRDYELVPVDAAAGHYVIDEKNGLLLDSYVADGVLYAPFAINGMLIMATYSVGTDGVMTANMPSFGTEPVRTTCLGGQPESCAQSFALNRAQHCRLSKVAMSKF